MLGSRLAAHILKRLLPAPAAVEPRTPSSDAADAADAAGAAEVEEDVEADLIKGTLQYTEAQARLRGWLEPYPYPYP